ncbi:MAG: TolC family protein [Tenuifilaceae bacterium]|jgi:outer membrane protein|nr:TolC family protein [Tenuifilaceae bacterium]
MISSKRIMRILKCTIFLIAIVGTWSNAWAQKGWNLEECIDFALQNNIQLKRSQLQEEIAQQNLTQSTFELGPNLGASFTHQYNNGSIFNQYTGRFERLENQGGRLGISSSITVFNGFYGINNRARLKYQLLSRKEDTEILKDNITLNVVVGFLQILMDSESLRLATEQLKLANDLVSKAESQLNLGTISQGDYLNLQSQMLNQQAQVINTQNKLTNSTLDLAQLLEVENPSEFVIEVTPLVIPDFPEKMEPKQFFDQIAGLRPEVKKAEFNIKSSQKSVKMAYSQLSPRLTLGYSFGSGYDQTARSPEDGIEYPDYTYLQQIKDYNQHFVELRLNVPIFQKLSASTQISQSKIQLLDAKYAKEETEKGLYKSIVNAHAEALGAWNNFLAYNESVKSYKELYDQTSNRFKLGMINAQELGIAQNNLIKAEGDLLYAKYAYVLRMKILDFYRGVPIAL